MKIKELEEKTGIGRAAIRFYEKQGLISPDRNKENEYREYSDEDESRLRKIIILRKLGFSVSEIQDLFEGSADLETQLASQIVILEEQKKELDGAIAVCRQLKNSSITLDSMDPLYYWDEISRKETEGYSFFEELAADTRTALYQAASQVEYSPGHGPRTPDLIWNPMNQTTKKINSFWEKHSLIRIILVILILTASLAFVIAISGM